MGNPLRDTPLADREGFPWDAHPGQLGVGPVGAGMGRWETS